MRVAALGEVALVKLGRDREGRPIEAIVLHAEGALKVYLNRCLHLPIPLDGGSGEVLAPDRTHLRCGTHGALYRPADGLCVLGPCKGASLEALAFRVDEDGWLWITPPA